MCGGYTRIHTCGELQGLTDILIIEDNEELGNLVRDFLKREGYSVQLARSAEEGLELIGKAAFKMLLLDVMLPGMNGYETLQEIRKEQKLPVLMMSAKTDEQSKVLGYEVGADDYIDKPFSFQVLGLKIKALMKRTYKKEKLFDEIWEVDCFSDLGSLNVHIRWLREKLEDDPRNPKLIRTVWRVGYQFGGAEN